MAINIATTLQLPNFQVLQVDDLYPLCQIGLAHGARAVGPIQHAQYWAGVAGPI